MTGRFSFVPGASPTCVIIVIAARDVVSGVFHVMNLDARTALKRHIHEHIEGEDKGEKENNGEKARAGAFGRFPQP